MFLTRCCYCIPLKTGCEVIAAITFVMSLLEIITISPIVKPWMVAVVVLVYLVIMGLSAFFFYAVEKQWIFIIYIFVYIYWVYAVICIAMALTIQIQGKRFMSSVLEKPESSNELQRMADRKNGSYFLMFLINLYFIVVIYSFYRQEHYGTDEDDNDDESVA